MHVNRIKIGQTSETIERTFERNEECDGIERGEWGGGWGGVARINIVFRNSSCVCQVFCCCCCRYCNYVFIIVIYLYLVIMPLPIFALCLVCFPCAPLLCRLFYLPSNWILCTKQQRRKKKWRNANGEWSGKPWVLSFSVFLFFCFCTPLLEQIYMQ